MTLREKIGTLMFVIPFGGACLFFLAQLFIIAPYGVLVAVGIAAYFLLAFWVRFPNRRRR